MKKEEISILLNERNTIYKNNSDDIRVDEIKDQIMFVIKKDFDSFEVDFIIETLTSFGDGPNIVYDDNGLFAVSSDGMQPVVTGDEKIEGSLTIFVEAQQWKPSIREALKHYLFA